MKNKMLGALIAGLGALSLVGVALATPDEQDAPNCICDTVDGATAPQKPETPDTGHLTAVKSAELSLEVEGDAEVDDVADTEIEIAASSDGNETADVVSAEAEAATRDDAGQDADNGHDDDGAAEEESEKNDGKHSKVRTVKRSIAGLLDCTFEVVGGKLRLVKAHAPGFNIDADARSDSRIDLTLTKTLVQVDITALLEADGDVTLSLEG